MKGWCFTPSHLHNSSSATALHWNSEGDTTKAARKAQYIHNPTAMIDTKYH
jgi:hypothetical protein